MKKSLLALLSTLCLLSSSAAYCDATVELKTGTYDMQGNTDGSENMCYNGLVTIKPKGKNFAVCWIFGGSKHYGIGILEQNVLSVAFYAPRSGFRGTVAYLVNPDGTLVGKWAPARSELQGIEKLTWLTASYPGSVGPMPDGSVRPIFPDVLDNSEK